MPAVPGPVFRRIAPEETASMTEVRPRRSEARWWLGLMWGEWFTHARLLLFFLVAWLAAFWLILRGYRVLGFLATAPLAIPGIVLGVGLFLAYTRPPLARSPHQKRSRRPRSRCVRSR